MASETTVKQTETSRAERTRRGLAYRPRVDILETPAELTLVAELPGVKSEQVDIDFEDGILTIQGRVEPRYGEQANFLLYEYPVGDFYRTFRVSEQVDAAGIHAECAHGVLTVHLPKAAAAKPRRIAVKAGS